MHYTGTIWRPPYEANSLLLEVTAGCTHHRCKFCTLYEDLPFQFRMSPLEDIEDDLQEAGVQLELQLRAWTGESRKKEGKTGDSSEAEGRGNDGCGKSGTNSSMKQDSGQKHRTLDLRTFLTGANPFVLKTSRLLKIADLIQKYVPENRTIGCFSRVTDISLKTDEDLRELRTAGYDGLTIGIETGHDPALDFMNKGYNSGDILTQCRRLEKAGISYNFFYLTGISGAGKGEEGARATAHICNQLRPQIIGASMLTVYPDSRLYEEIQRGSWQEEGEIEKYREMKTLVQNLDIPVWFGALGASNPIPIEGTLPEHKAEILSILEKIISSAGEEQLLRYRKNLRHL